MAQYAQPRVFTIAPGVPFLPNVAQALCDGRLVPGFRYSGDPLQLSRASIYVPTRRAARELRSAFLDHLGGETILLPRIRPLGEFDEDTGLFEIGDAGAIDIPPAIDGTERLLLLGMLVRAWTRHLRVDVGTLYGDELITTPVSTADCFWLARDLADLMDQFSTGQVPVSDVSGLDASELSEWWKVTSAFLEIMRREWPDILAERRVIDPGDHRIRGILAEAARLGANPPQDPVVVAGSTGTIPATAELIKAISRLPGGAVVLPGFDREMDDASRAVLAAADTDLASVVGHPQFGLNKLLSQIEIAADAVEPLGESAGLSLAARAEWVSESLRPAPVTDRWTGTRGSLDASAFDDVALLEAQNEHEEAAAIAAALREAIRDPKAMSALVTPDRLLARRVVSELARYGIHAVDTGGAPLTSTLQGRLLGLVLQTVFNPGDPSTLLALLKHPHTSLSLPEKDLARRVDHLEMAVLRGKSGRIEPSGLRDYAAGRILAESREAARPSRWLARMSADDRAQLLDLCEALEAALAPLTRLATDAGETTFHVLIEATIRALEAICRDEDGFHDALYEGEAGAVLHGFLTSLVAAEFPMTMKADDWPQAVAALLADLSVKPSPGGHPRISIWGTLEARLQTVDMMVLGGLNERTWPAHAREDQFLTRSMKAGLGLDPPERRIGLSAHDFQMAMGQRQVVLARSLRADGAPAIASRWLQRMTTFAGGAMTARLKIAGDRYIALARAVEAGVPAPFAPRPCPAPPLAARPTKISVTEVETLIRDPYAVYAKRVLGLQPLDDLVRDPGAAERGSLFHAIFEHIACDGIDPMSPDAGEQMMTIARTLFDDEALPADIRAVWWPRIENAVRGIAKWEQDRAPSIAARLAELSAVPIEVAATGVCLGGRADRMDVGVGGAVDIIDFKTGSPPTAEVVKALLSPQLPLEGALLRRGAFRTVGSATIGAMLYVKVDPRGKIETRNVLKGTRETGDADPEVLSEEAWEKLAQMLGHYGIETTGYLSRRLPQKIRDRLGDYDHLARMHEWLAGEDDADE